MPEDETAAGAAADRHGERLRAALATVIADLAQPTTTDTLVRMIAARPGDAAATYATLEAALRDTVPLLPEADPARASWLTAHSLLADAMRDAVDPLRTAA